MTGRLRGVFSKCLHSLKFIDCCEASEKNFFILNSGKSPVELTLGVFGNMSVCPSIHPMSVYLKLRELAFLLQDIGCYIEL